MQVGELEKMTLPELTALYNENVPEEKRIKKFRNKETALARVADLGVAEAKKPKKKSESKEGRREGTFNREPADVIKHHRPGTKRDIAVKLLSRKNGATIEEVMEACDWPYRTAYEGVTLLHRHLGYGLRQEGDQIFLVGEPTQVVEGE